MATANFYTFGICAFTIFGIAAVNGEPSAEHRNLTIKINPGCETSHLGPGCDRQTNVNLIHIRSDSDEDSLHFVWSFDGAPSVLVARTSLFSNLTVEWEEYLEGHTSSVSFDSESATYAFGWSLYKVWMFTDEHDNVTLDKVNQSSVYGYETKHFKWERQNVSVSPEEIKITFTSTQYANQNLSDDGNSYFRFAVKVRNSDGYSDVLPYMLHNGNVTQVDIDFQKVEFDHRKPNKTRFGFALALAQDAESRAESMSVVKSKTLDDEHTPGVFEMYSVRTPLANQYDQSYLQWKPVCYVAKVRDITDSIDVIEYGIKNTTELTDNPMHAISNSILSAYFGDRNGMNQILVEFLNISFGTEGDGFFEKTSHISWTYLTGYGTPPEDYVSLTVKLVVAIGLGVPALIIILAGAYVVIKRLSKPKDDLLLGR